MFLLYVPYNGEKVVMDKESLFKAKRKDNGDWIEGNLLLYDNGTAQIHHRQEWYAYDVEPDTICRCTGKEYMDSDIAWEGDIFESQLSGDLMVLRYGTYQAFCPVDQQFMDSVGFYAECKRYSDMPIGPLKDYALKKGNIFDNPELLQNNDLAR